MDVSRFIATRLSLRQRGSRKPSPAVAVATAGVALSLAVMLLAIAVTSGFKSQITDKVSGIAAQIRITPVADPNAVIQDDEPLIKLCNEALAPFEQHPGSLDVTSTSTVAGLLKTPTDFAGLAFKGYEPEAKMEFEKSMLTDGEMPQPGSKNKIAISRTTADALGLNTGEKVYAYFVAGQSFRTRRFEISGIYNSNFGELDKNMAYTSCATVKSLLGLDSLQAHAIEIRGIDFAQLDRATTSLQSAINQAFSSGRISEIAVATPVTASAAGYFNWLDMLDTNIVVILVLMGCVSAFMVISCVLILVLQRVRMVGVLQALGSPNSQIERVFILLGARVVLKGMLIGNAMALLLCILQHYFKLIPLDPANYYLSYVPVSLSLTQWLCTNAVFALFCIATTMLPALLVERLTPSRTMRWEQ